MFNAYHLSEAQSTIRKAQRYLSCLSIAVGLIELGYYAAVTDERKHQTYNPTAKEPAKPTDCLDGCRCCRCKPEKETYDFRSRNMTNE